MVFCEKCGNMLRKFDKDENGNIVGICKCGYTKTPVNLADLKKFYKPLGKANGLNITSLNTKK